MLEICCYRAYILCLNLTLLKINAFQCSLRGWFYGGRFISWIIWLAKTASFLSDIYVSRVTISYVIPLGTLYSYSLVLIFLNMQKGSFLIQCMSTDIHLPNSSHLPNAASCDVQGKERSSLGIHTPMEHQSPLQRPQRRT